MSFTQLALESVDKLYNKIIEHPFNTELANGTLKRISFEHYLIQDSIYLIDFAKTLAIIATKFNQADKITMFLDFSKGALVIERELHHRYFSQFNIQAHNNPSPACQHYTQFLLATSLNKSIEEALAAVLPCFVIYQKVGTHIQKKSQQNNPYQAWVDTYASGEFDAITKDMCNIIDEVGACVSNRTQKNMLATFAYSTQLEYKFWQSAYTLENW